MKNIWQIPIMSKHKTTMRKASKNTDTDKKIQYMTESDAEVVGFDAVKKDYTSSLHLNTSPSSVDAILQTISKRYFIEFKNGFIGSKEQNSIIKKVYDSLLIYGDISKESISDIRNNTELVLVYNESANKDNDRIRRLDDVENSPSLEEFSKNIHRLAKEEYVSFGLNMFQTYCFSKVHTYTRLEFEKMLDSIDSEQIMRKDG